MSATPKNSGKSQAELIYKRQQRQIFRFKLGVRISWAFFLAALLFLFSSVSFNIFGMQIKTIALDFDFIRQWIPFIARGMSWTILLSILSIVLASVLALLGALGRLSRFPPAYALASFYISLIRGTPLLVQILFFFLAVDQLGIHLPGFWAGVIALGLNYGAYTTEIMRAGIQSVNIGQREAALAIGMAEPQIMRRIVLPQALRVVVPPIGNQLIAMLKDTSLISVTGAVHELLWRAQTAGKAEFRMMEAMLVAAAFYWMVTIIFEVIQSRIEAHLAKGERT